MAHNTHRWYTPTYSRLFGCKNELSWTQVAWVGRSPAPRSREGVMQVMQGQKQLVIYCIDGQSERLFVNHEESWTEYGTIIVDQQNTHFLSIVFFLSRLRLERPSHPKLGPSLAHCVTTNWYLRRSYGGTVVVPVTWPGVIDIVSIVPLLALLLLLFDFVNAVIWRCFSWCCFHFAIIRHCRCHRLALSLLLFTVTSPPTYDIDSTDALFSDQSNSQ